MRAKTWLVNSRLQSTSKRLLVNRLHPLPRRVLIRRPVTSLGMSQPCLLMASSPSRRRDTQYGMMQCRPSSVSAAFGGIDSSFNIPAPLVHYNFISFSNWDYEIHLVIETETLPSALRRLQVHPDYPYSTTISTHNNLCTTKRLRSLVFLHFCPLFEKTTLTDRRWFG